MAKNIDIRTAQQVTLSYDLATAGSRILATIIDVIAMALLVYLTQTGLDSSLTAAWISFSVFTFYHLIFESTMNGRSPGKMVMGIRVMRTDGAPLEFADCFLRWIMRPLDLTFTGGALSLFMVLGTEKRQRLGDLMAGTAVVSNKYSLHYSFSDLMQLHEKRSQTDITWPELRHIEEKHILFIKNVLNSREQFTAAVYKKALQACTEKMAGLLQLSELPKDQPAFLQQIVSEYIVLTR